MDETDIEDRQLWHQPLYPNSPQLLQTSTSNASEEIINLSTKSMLAPVNGIYIQSGFFVGAKVSRKIYYDNHF